MQNNEQIKKMKEFVEQLIELFQKMINYQDWLENSISLISYFDKQVRINGCKLYLNSWLKMEEQGYKGYLKYQYNLKDIIKFIDDDSTIIIQVS
ncbi:unnamed protein product [Paramecium sonneborni]|uniref:Uncharacterized protein n=1 Tax=Paramecium sonneborni TaxID=65129 RepID=A0A8S1NHD1_9CILI|nr:unnamed protein product [Paramecium sonneborni]